MAYYYDDAYLQKHCNTAQEIRATEQIDNLGIDFSDEWKESLVVLRVYLNVCLSHQADTEDLYTAKFKSYSKEFDRQLAMAKSATPDTDGNTAQLFSVPLERG